MNHFFSFFHQATATWQRRTNCQSLEETHVKSELWRISTPPKRVPSQDCRIFVRASKTTPLPLIACSELPNQKSDLESLRVHPSIPRRSSLRKHAGRKRVFLRVLNRVVLGFLSRIKPFWSPSRFELDSLIWDLQLKPNALEAFDLEFFWNALDRVFLAPFNSEALGPLWKPMEIFYLDPSGADFFSATFDHLEWASSWVRSYRNLWRWNLQGREFWREQNIWSTCHHSVCECMPVGQDPIPYPLPYLVVHTQLTWAFWKDNHRRDRRVAKGHAQKAIQLAWFWLSKNE